MKARATTIALLLLVTAVLSPLVAFLEPTSVKVIIVIVQLVCLFVIGLNIRPSK